MGTNCCFPSLLGGPNDYCQGYPFWSQYGWRKFKVCWKKRIHFRGTFQRTVKWVYSTIGKKWVVISPFPMSLNQYLKVLLFKMIHQEWNQIADFVWLEENDTISTLFRHTISLSKYWKADIKPPSFISSWCKAALTQFALWKALYK